MQIFLRYVLGGPYCLDVEPTDTILEVINKFKKHIQLMKIYLYIMKVLEKRMKHYQK